MGAGNAKLIGMVLPENRIPRIAQNYSNTAFDPRVIGLGIPAAAATGRL